MGAGSGRSGLRVENCRSRHRAWGPSTPGTTFRPWCGPTRRLHGVEPEINVVGARDFPLCIDAINADGIICYYRKAIS